MSLSVKEIWISGTPGDPDFLSEKRQVSARQKISTENADFSDRSQTIPEQFRPDPGLESAYRFPSGIGLALRKARMESIVVSKLNFSGVATNSSPVSGMTKPL
jgi:hypothetical protein